MTGDEEVQTEEIQEETQEQEDSSTETETETKEEEKEVEVPTDPKELKSLLNLVAGSVRQMNTEMQNLKAQLNQKPVEPEKTVEASDFHADPGTHTKNIVKETLEKVNAPLLEEVAAMRRERNFNNLLNQYVELGGDPVLVDQYKNYLPKVMAAQELNVNNLDAALAFLVGQTQMGRIKIDAPSKKNSETTKTEGDKRTMSTPTTKPSPSIPARKKDTSGDDAVGRLTESEKAYIKRAGLSLEEGAALMNADARVDKWPRPAKKEGK